MSIKAVFFTFVCPPGLKNDNPKLFFHTSEHQFLSVAVLLPNCDFTKPTLLACFYGFRVSLLDVGAVQNPIKRDPVAEAVPGHIFNMLSQKDNQKKGSNKVSVFIFLRRSFFQFSSVELFFYFLPEWPQIHKREHRKDTDLGPFVKKLGQRFK